MADYDLAIIGGGINGAGIARDAAGRGLRVLLLEQNDLGSGTSSASTKLIHGGLRYLEHYAFMMVREVTIAMMLESIKQDLAALNIVHDTFFSERSLTDGHDEVAAARSSFSTSNTDNPRPAASRAMPAPLMPPPIIRRS